MRLTRLEPSELFGVGMLVLLAVCAIGPGLIEPRAPGAIDPTAVLAGPSWAHVLGTDALGRDVLSRVVAGTGGTLAGPVVLALASLAASIPLALLAGLRGGAVDPVISRAVDVVYALPVLVIAIVVVGVFGGGLWIAVAVLTVLHIPQNVRLLRAAVLERRHAPYVEAAEVLGVSRFRIAVWHLLAPILPLVRALLFVRLTYGLIELSSLSFLGFGTTPGSTNWGRMVAENRSEITVNAWATLGPALALALAALSANVLGERRSARRVGGWRTRFRSRAGVGHRNDQAGSDPAPGLVAERLGIDLPSGRETVEIVSELALSVAPGEAVALLGESGAGKSLTARALVGLLPVGLERSGEVRWDGAPEPPRRGADVSLLLQDPATMLGPLERCGSQVVAGLRDRRGRRLDGAARRALAIERLDEVGLRGAAFVDRFPFELSGGERQRVAIAAALARRPAVLIADEPTSSLDASARGGVLALLGRLRREHQLGLLLITHNLGVAQSACDRVHVMYAGRIVESAPADQLSRAPRHPYSLGLLLADPPVHERVDRLAALPGSMPGPDARPPGCPFAPRCRWSMPRCTEGPPPAMSWLSPERATRCVRVAEIAPELDRARITARGLGSAGVPAGGERLVAARGLQVVFGRRPPAIVLDGVDIQINGGASVGLVGDSGTGKTTLARCLLGLVAPSAGTVEVAGIASPARGRRARETIRSTVQVVFQDPAGSLNPALKVGTALAEALALAGRSRDEVPSLLEGIGLPAELARRRPATLSGGECQRVAIARALARRPRLLICDEITAALDVGTQAQILELLRELRMTLGLALLVISHDLAIVRQLTDELHVLAGGRIVESGPTEELLADPAHETTRRLLTSART